MPRPVDRERRGLRRLVVWLICSIAAAIIAARFILFLVPPTELDKRCLRKPLAQLQRCIWDAQNGRPGVAD